MPASGPAGSDVETVDDIDQVLWIKFVTVSAFSGGTSLMRSGIGPILADPEARIFIEQLRDEGMAVASAAGHPMPDGFAENVIALWRTAPARNGFVDEQRSCPRQADRTRMAVGTRARAWERARRADSGTYGGLSCAAFARRGNRSLTASPAYPGRQGMNIDRNVDGTSPSPGADDAQAMFNRQLATYRKIVGANLMFHREVYGLLRNVLSGTDVEAVQVSRHRLRGCNGVSGSAQGNCRRPLLRHRPFRTVVGARDAKR